MQQNVNSSSSYLPSLELVQRESVIFSDCTDTKVDLQIAQCAHGVCALHSSSLSMSFEYECKFKLVWPVAQA